MRARTGNRRKNSSPIAFLIALITATALVSLSPGCGGNQASVVRLDSGRVSGSFTHGLSRYLGIPYAAPPVGELRWLEPQPVRPWNGVRACTKVGPECPQVEFIHKKNAARQSEDCLYLNVWTPAKKASEKLPVMFWIHGGAYQMGAGGLPLYDGEKLAKKGVVVVTINYRLGPFGFLAHPQLTKESANSSSGNYGVLDQQAALQWVKRNIAAFGGDPAKVTIFGESAGAMSVLNQLVSPLSAGLFQQAISESTLFVDRGLLMHATRPLAEAEGIGEQYAVEMGCAGASDVLAAMRAKTADELLGIPQGKSADLRNSIKAITSPGLFIMDPKFVPVVDGWVLPEDPGTMVASGEQHNVPLLIGSNREEGNLFVFGADISESLLKMSIEEYQGKIREYFRAVRRRSAGNVPGVSAARNPEAAQQNIHRLRFHLGGQVRRPLPGSQGTESLSLSVQQNTAPDRHQLPGPMPRVRAALRVRNPGQGKNTRRRAGLHIEPAYNKR